MKLRSLVTLLILALTSVSLADDSYTETYETLVDKDGNISLPDNFRDDWTFLGTWSIAAEDVKQSSEASGHGAAGLHNVYTQRGVAAYFREHDSFPDGAVLIKELLKATTAPMTTGIVSHGSEVEGWFVMVKDTKGRFTTNPLWGDGWGWVLFNASDRHTAVTKNFKTECVGCHIPARDDDWIYTAGYSILFD